MSQSENVAVDHDEPVRQLAVSPTTHTEWRSTLRPILKPVACWRIHQAYYQFGSSVILPEIATELRKLEPLVSEQRLASIFGHADPVGDAYRNARLSARRARALFGLLTRNADVWIALFDDPPEYDKWGLASTQTMLAALRGASGTAFYTGIVDGKYGSLTEAAIRTFQSEQHEEDTGLPLEVDGTAGPKTRKRLYQVYIDSLTGLVQQPMMTPAHFLGDPSDNADPKGAGQGAFQGCGEMNPILLPSSANEERYSKATNKAERDAYNAPNRRAMILFFAKARLLPLAAEDVAKSWPCPAWNEGPGACQKMLWPDHEKRLKPGEEERRYDKGERTMGCRWYDSMARLSPCEGRPRSFVAWFEAEPVFEPEGHDE